MPPKELKRNIFKVFFLHIYVFSYFTIWYFYNRFKSYGSSRLLILKRSHTFKY